MTPPNGQPLPSNGEGFWSEQKLMMKDYVLMLAHFEDGETKDIAKQGSVTLWPGVTLLAEIINTDPALIDPEVPEYADRRADASYIYALTAVSDDGTTIEGLQIDDENGSLLASDEYGSIFPIGTSAPDYMIQSFFARYRLNSPKGDNSELTTNT